MKLNVLKPSVNSLPVRVLMRAAGLAHEEVDAWGHTRSPEYLAKCPAHMTPMLETSDLAMGALWESCAIMQYLCNKHGLTKYYPADPAKRAVIDSAMFYLTGTLYPLLSRATYPALGFPGYAGEVGASDASPAEKEKARKAAEEALAEPLEVFRSFYIGSDKFIGGATPSIADMRFAATLEFLAAIDYKLPAWAKSYVADMEKALGKAYMEPAGDVRGFIQYVKSQKK
ncbi:MAG: glutathione S-transferase family protein [Alphaproteobacteria bacterium]|nr:glutathione S-transferase family protein [Alphaproteobacteria bacterium]